MDDLSVYFIVVFRRPPSPRLPAAVLAIADSGPVGKEGARPTMPACDAVLHTRSVSSRPTHLHSSRQSAYESPQFPVFVFKSLRTLSFSVSPKSCACHSYENCRVCTNNSQSGTPYELAPSTAEGPLISRYWIQAPSFHTLTHSFARLEMPTPLFSSIPALFAQNMGVGGGGGRGAYFSTEFPLTSKLRLLSSGT